MFPSEPDKTCHYSSLTPSRNLDGGFLPKAATPKRTGHVPRNSQFEIVMALLRYSFWVGRLGQTAFECPTQSRNNSMKNWITIIEDGDSIITAHFPINRVRLVIEAKDKIKIHFEKGSIGINGAGVGKLVPKLLAGDLPVLKSGVTGIKSVTFDREN
jgi:hypothetical protein